MSVSTICWSYLLFAVDPPGQEAGLGFAWVLYVLVAVLAVLALLELLGWRYIPNNRVGIVEKLWSPKGSVSEGRIIAMNGEAGYQADLLRGGFHFALWR